MNIALRFTVAIIGVAFTFMVYYLLIRKKMTERITLFWSVLAIVAVVFSIFPGPINWVAESVGVSYPPALIFLVSILFLMLLIIYQSMQISMLEQRSREVGRAVALLENEIRKHYMSDLERNSLNLSEDKRDKKINR